MTIRAEYEVRGKTNSKAIANQTKRDLGTIGRSISALSGSFLGLAGAAGFGAAIKGAIDFGDRIQKLSISTGISTEALSRLSHQAELMGTSFEPAVKAMQQLQRSAVEGSTGTKSYADSFAALGINVNEFVKLNAEDMLLQMSDAMIGLNSTAERTAFAMELMGRSGKDLIPLLLEGSDALKKMGEEADAAGVTLTRMEADAMANANDAMTRMKLSLRGLTQTLAVSFAPAIVLATSVIRGLIDVVFQLLKSWGAVAAALVALAKGEFQEAYEAIKVGAIDVKNTLVVSGKRIAESWDSIANASRKSSAAMEEQTSTVKTLADESLKVPAALDLTNSKLELLEGTTKGAGANVTGLSTVLTKLSDSIDRLSAVLPALSENFIQAGQAAMFMTGSMGAAATPTEPRSSPGGQFKFFSASIPRNFGGTTSTGRSFATGGIVPRTGAHFLEEGEKVISNRVSFGDVNINVSGGLSQDPNALRDMVRNQIMPEIKRAMER